MRRVLASLLLAVFSFPLISPAFSGGADANLPACCRRDGKHHCAMTMNDAPAPSGLGFRRTPARCPMYPGALAVPAAELAALVASPVAVFGSVASHPAIRLQAEAVYRISFDRSHQKRGPPARLS